MARHSVLVTPPAAEPVTPEVALAHLRADGVADADLIAVYLAAAREAVEAETGRALAAQTWELRLDAFPPCGGVIELPRAPLVSVTSIVYLDADGAEQTLAAGDYQVVTPTGPTAQPGRVLPAAGGSWPATQCGAADAVRITYVCGHTDAPAALKAAILLVLGDLYEHREAGAERAITEIPAVARLLAPYLVIWL